MVVAFVVVVVVDDSVQLAEDAGRNTTTIAGFVWCVCHLSQWSSAVFRRVD